MAKKKSPRAKGKGAQALFQAGPTQPSSTPFKIVGSRPPLVALNTAQSAPPNGQIRWYYSGPAGATCTISLRRVANSGGHLHAGGPVGTAQPSRFTLQGKYPQNFVVTITLPDAAGTITQTESWSTGQAFQNTNICRLPGLVQLTTSPGVILTGATSNHPVNHFGTPRLVNAVKQLGSKFNAQFKKPIYVNDMSLQDGGLYDFKSQWAPPHKTHREGRTVDINSSSMNDTERTFFRTTAAGLGFTVTLENVPGFPEHWHLYI